MPSWSDTDILGYSERSMRDQIVIRLVLYFIRNLAAIPDLNVSQSAPEESLMMASMQVIGFQMDKRGIDSFNHSLGENVVAFL